MQIRQWKQLHHSKGHGIYEVPRRVWYGMKGRNLWVAGTRISGQIIEGDEVLAHRAALDGIVNTRVWIPDLASVRRTPPVGIEGARLIVWVELITAEFSKVSCALQGAGYPGIFRDRAAGATALIVKEEEGAVFPDRSANGDTELVPAHWRNLYAIRVVEKVVGVELVVAQEFIDAAVKIVGSRARHDIHNGGSAEADFRAEIRLLHFELLHSVD